VTTKRSAPNARAVARALGGARNGSNGWFNARCPAHDDRVSSLAVRDTDDGGIAYKCMAGCSSSDVGAALATEGLLAERNSPTKRPRQRRSIIATYDYLDERGDLQFHVVRFEPKEFDNWDSTRGVGTTGNGNAACRKADSSVPTVPTLTDEVQQPGYKGVVSYPQRPSHDGGNNWELGTSHTHRDTALSIAGVPNVACAACGRLVPHTVDETMPGPNGRPVCMQCYPSIRG
jgi:hypothetical protein